MPTIDRLSSTAAFSWLRGEAGRLRRAMMAQRPAVRMGLVLAPVLLLVAAVYWAAGTLASAGPRFLAQGRAFSSEDLITICRTWTPRGSLIALDDRQGPGPGRSVRSGGGPVAKLDVGPQPISEIREPAPSSRERSSTAGRRSSGSGSAREVDRAVHRRPRGRRLVGRVASSAPGPRFSRNAGTKPSAFVYLE